MLFDRKHLGNTPLDWLWSGVLYFGSTSLISGSFSINSVSAASEKSSTSFHAWVKVVQFAFLDFFSFLKCTLRTLGILSSVGSINYSGLLLVRSTRLSTNQPLEILDLPFSSNENLGVYNFGLSVIALINGCFSLLLDLVIGVKWSLTSSSEISFICKLATIGDSFEKPPPSAVMSIGKKSISSSNVSGRFSNCTMFSTTWLDRRSRGRLDGSIESVFSSFPFSQHELIIGCQILLIPLWWYQPVAKQNFLKWRIGWTRTSKGQY